MRKFMGKHSTSLVGDTCGDVGVVGRSKMRMKITTSYHKHPNFPYEVDYCPPSLSHYSVLKEIEQYNVPRALVQEDLLFLRKALDIVCDIYFDTLWTGIGTLPMEEAIEFYLGYPTAAGPAFGGSKRRALEDPINLTILKEYYDNDCAFRSISSASPKDELLPTIKVERDGKVRAFIGVSMIPVIVQHMLFHRQNEEAKALWEEGAPFAYGFTKQYQGWDKLFRPFLHKNVTCIDLKKCDKTLTNVVLGWFYSFRARKLHEATGIDHHDRIMNLLWDITRSLLVLPDGLMVVKQGGNSSGQLNTTFDNTVMLNVYRVASCLKFQTDHFSLAMHYGDDTLLHGKGENFIEFCAGIGVTALVDYEGPFIGSTFISHTMALARNGMIVGLGNIDKQLARLAYTDGRSLEDVEDIIGGLVIESYPWRAYDDFSKISRAIDWLCEEWEYRFIYFSDALLYTLYFSPKGAEPRVKRLEEVLIK